MDKQKFQNLVQEKGWWEAYSVYLSSKSWEQKREAVLKRDNNECQTCDATDNLEIHHKRASSYKEIPNELITDLITLCRDCHKAITSSIRHRRYQGRDIKIQFYQEPREAQKELVSYGMERCEVSVEWCQPADPAQWRTCESNEPNCKEYEENIWEAKQDRSRFRGIGPA